MSSFFEEVKRRKVYRVAVAYVVAAGGIIQLASATFPAWELPNWALRLVIVLLLLGFPIALIFAWAFDLTREGIQRTPKAVTAVPGRTRRNIVALCVVGLGISATAGFFLLPRLNAQRVEKSIAVLPFENLSTDPGNAFFADGLQDDILTNLAKIGDLKVISRTSVMPYRGRPTSVREIGRELGVATVLEGSVRKEGNRIRLNVQLIDTRTDEHLWAEDYDRDLTDVFAIQTDLAAKVAEELRAKLSPSEMARIARKPTGNAEAYLAYVRARNLTEPNDLEKLRQAAQAFQRAIELDPQFAVAYAYYSKLESWLYRSKDQSATRMSHARLLAERALQLQPGLPEGHLALGFVYYYGDLNYEAALREFQTAQQGLPNEAEVYLALGAIQRRQGRWEESTANLEKAAALNPKSTWVLQNLYFNYQMLRQWEKAEQTLSRALALEPDSHVLWELKARTGAAAKGDLSAALEALEKVKQLPADNPIAALKAAEMRAQVLFAQRKYAEALATAENLRDLEISEVPGGSAGKYFWIGILKKRLNDEAGAREAFETAKRLAEAEMKTRPEDALHHIFRAKILANLGEKEAALAEVQRAMTILPESKDAFNGPDVTQGAAEVMIYAGEDERAIELLEGLLARPSAVTVPLLKIDPTLDPLRDNPRFQALLKR